MFRQKVNISSLFTDELFTAKVSNMIFAQVEKIALVRDFSHS